MIEQFQELPIVLKVSKVSGDNSQIFIALEFNYHILFSSWIDNNSEAIKAALPLMLNSMKNEMFKAITLAKNKSLSN